MTDKLSATDPEPPIGSVVVDYQGDRWIRFDLTGARWRRIDEDNLPEDDDPESWTKVAGNFGPVTAEPREGTK